MSLDLPAFADAEEVLVSLLTPALPGVSVVKGTPPQLVPPIVRIRRLGGHSDYVTDMPELLVVTLADKRPASMQLQLRCQQVIENAFATNVTLPDGTIVLIDGTETMTSGHPQPYENVDVRESAAIYGMKMRRPWHVP